MSIEFRERCTFGHPFQLEVLRSGVPSYLEGWTTVLASAGCSAMTLREFLTVSLIPGSLTVGDGSWLAVEREPSPRYAQLAQPGDPRKDAPPKHNPGGVLGDRPMRQGRDGAADESSGANHVCLFPQGFL